MNAPARPPECGAHLPSAQGEARGSQCTTLRLPRGPAVQSRSSVAPRPEGNPVSAELPFFAFLPAGHAFRPQVEAFAAELAARPDCLALARGEGLDPACGESAGRTAIHAEIKAVPVAGGGFALDRFYWSGQRWSAGGFAASTLTYAARDGRAAWQEFPHDPYLDPLAGHFGPAAQGCEVLRYVPLRRFTFRTPHPTAGVAIGKFKRRSRFRQAYALLEQVSAAVARRDPGFAVAAPLGIDALRGLYFQQALPGEDLAQRLDATNAEALLERVGELHARLHRLVVPGLEAWRPDALRAAVAQDLAWIAFVRPELGAEMRRAATLLAARTPALTTEASCHGDFVCSQVLVDGDRWAITDFDLACLGDPCRDAAMFVAGLGYDLPWLARALAAGRPGAAQDVARCAGAYLGAYAATRPAARRFTPDRLAWHLASAEVYYLALMLKKDRYAAPAFAAGLERLRDALAVLA